MNIDQDNYTAYVPQRYHVQVEFPKGIDLASFIADMNELTYSRHAKEQVIHDRYGLVPVVSKAMLSTKQIFEIVCQNGTVVSAVFRVPFGNTLDTIVSVNSEGIVITTWLNKTSDRHKTLKTDLYSIPGVI